MSQQPVPVSDFSTITDPDKLNLYVEACAQTLYYELGGLGPDSQVAPASASGSGGGGGGGGGGSSSGSSSSSAATASSAAASSSTGPYQKLVPSGARGGFYTQIPERGALKFQKELKKDLAREYANIFDTLIAPSVGDASGEPVNPEARKLFIEEMKKLICPGCLEHREGGLMEGDHMAAFAFIKDRLNEFLNFLNDSKNVKFSDKLVKHDLLKGVFSKKKGKFVIRGSGLARAYSARYNIWLLCRLCNGDKSDQAPEAWLKEQPNLKEFLGDLAKHGLIMGEGFLVSGLFDKTSSGPVLQVAGRPVFLHGSKMRSLGLSIIRWLCSNNKTMLIALGNLQSLKSSLRAQIQAAKAEGNSEKIQRLTQEIDSLQQIHKLLNSGNPALEQFGTTALSRAVAKITAKQVIQKALVADMKKVLTVQVIKSVFDCLGDKCGTFLNKPSWERLRKEVTTCIQLHEGTGLTKAKLEENLKELFSRYASKVDEKLAAPGRKDPSASVNVSDEETEPNQVVAVVHRCESGGGGGGGSRPSAISSGTATAATAALAGSTDSSHHSSSGSSPARKKKKGEDDSVQSGSSSKKKDPDHDESQGSGHSGGCHS